MDTILSNEGHNKMNKGSTTIEKEGNTGRHDQWLPGIIEKSPCDKKGDGKRKILNHKKVLRGSGKNAFIRQSLQQADHDSSDCLYIM